MVNNHDSSAHNLFSLFKKMTAENSHASLTKKSFIHILIFTAGEWKESNQSINFNKTPAITFKMAAAGVRNEEIVYDKAPEHHAK